MTSPPWSTTTKIIVVLLALAALLAFFVLALPLVEALSIAALLAFLLEPVVAWLIRRRRFTRPWAVRLVFVVALLLVMGLPAGFGALLVSGIERWAGDLGSALGALREWLSQPRLVLGIDISPRLWVERVGAALTGIAPLIPGGSLNMLSSLGQNLLWLLVILVSTYSFLIDGSKMKAWLLEHTPSSQRQDFEKLLDLIITVWAVFVRAQTVIFAILIGLFVLGAWVIVMLYQLGLIPFSTFGLVLLFVLLYALVTQVDNVWLKPVLYSQSMRLHPGLVFVALAASLAIGGVLLTFLIVPLIATAKVLAKYIRDKLWEDKALTPPAPEDVE